jgi:hypothetical protein
LQAYRYCDTADNHLKGYRSEVRAFIALTADQPLTL